MKGTGWLWVGWMVLGMGWGRGEVLHNLAEDWCGGCHEEHGGSVLLLRYAPARVFFDARWKVLPDSVSLFCLSCHGIRRDTFPNIVLLGSDLTDDHPVGVRMMASRIRTTALFPPATLPLWRGRMGCHTCHDSHARSQEEALRMEDPALCRECHGLGVSPGHGGERCGACHTMHGAPWEALTAWSSPELCGTCHAPSAACDPGVSCTRCHSIHGGKP